MQTQDEHEIQISALTKLIDYDSHDHKKIKQALMDLLATVVEWNIVDGDKLDKENVWNASSIIADASINGSVCTYSYSGKMRKLLYHPSVYGRLNMRVQAKFQSSYGLALYENCNRYQDIGQTPWFELEKFRKLMGVEESKYKIFRDLKTRVIDKSIEELNKYSQLFVEPKYKKLDRKVVAIQFLIKKQNTLKFSTKIDFESDTLPNTLKKDFGLSQTQIEKVITGYEETYIREKIKIIESSPSFQTGKIKNLGKYLLCAISDDYQAVVKISPRKRKEGAKENEKNTAAYQKFVRTKIIECYSMLDLEKKTVIETEFEKFIASTVYSSLYKIGGLNDAIVLDKFVVFIMSYENELSKQVPLIKNWVSEV